MFIISFVFLGRTTLWNWHFWLRTLSLVLVENKSDNFVKYFDQSELKLEESGLLTRKNISLDNPLWRWICVPWLLFFFYFFSVRLPLYQSQTCQLVHYEGFVSIGSHSQPDFCVKFSQSTSWMTSIVSRPGRGVSRLWWWPPRHWHCCLRSWC